MKILFEALAYKKWRTYIHSTDTEISGFGKIVKTDDVILVQDIKIFSQTVTGANTILSAQALAKFYDELMQADEEPSDWKLWWHSHVDMEAFFSGTDVDTIDEFDLELPEDNWMLSIVTNKRGESLTRIDVYQPIRCTLHNIPIDVQFNHDQDFVEAIKEEIEEKVITKKFLPITPHKGPYHSPYVPMTPYEADLLENEFLDEHGNPIELIDHEEELFSSTRKIDFSKTTTIVPISPNYPIHPLTPQKKLPKDFIDRVTQVKEKMITEGKIVLDTK